MTQPDAEIERIVREVLAEMGLLPSPQHAGENVGCDERGATTRLVPENGSESHQANQTSQPGDWPVAGRVVTLSDLPSQWNGVRRVVARPRAVVTPSVRDELQKRNVTLVLGENGPASSGAAPQGDVFLVVARASCDPAALAKSLQDDGFRVQTDNVDCLIAATARLAKDLRGGSALGVLLTKHAAAAICLANRHPGVRAILGMKLDAIATDAEAVGANLLVLDTAAGFFALRQMARQFLRGGLRPCPEVLQKRLG